MKVLQPLRCIKAGVLDVALYETGPVDGAPVLLMHGFPYDIQTKVFIRPPS